MSLAARLLPLLNCLCSFAAVAPLHRHSASLLFICSFILAAFVALRSTKNERRDEEERAKYRRKARRKCTST